MDMALSMSYCPSTGITNALLLGRSAQQLLFIRHQIKQLLSLIVHPALLPTLIYSDLKSLLQTLVDRQFNEMYRVERKSGRTYVGYNDDDDENWTSGANSGDDEISLQALGIIQLVTAWEAYINCLKVEVELVKKFVRRIDTKNSTCLTVHGEIIVERLDFIAHEVNTMQFTAKYVTERAKAQVSAVGSRPLFRP